MHTPKEYLFLAILSYLNFPDDSEGKIVYDILDDLDLEEISSNANLLRKDIYGNGNKFFEKEMKEWKIYKIDNRTGEKNKKQNSGFYAIIFSKKEEYVVSYRGSETYPLSEAYKDFIEADLVIGLGKKPLQFYEGIEVFENLLKDGIDFEKISMTGHSLGGGIAQFVAINIYKKFLKVPNTYTWNSVGIRRDGIVGIEDFLEYESILERMNLSKEEKKIFISYKDEYKEFIIKELKRNKIIKDNQTMLVDKGYKFKFDVNAEFIESVTKNTKLKEIFKKISIERKKEILLKNNFLGKLFQVEDICKKVYNAVKFIDIVKQNKVFKDNVINFCHSKDLVGTLYPHIGETYQVDLNFIKKEKSLKNSILNKFNIFNKSIQEYHFEDVFIPFFDENGLFNDEISLDYLASVLRKLIYLENNLDREFLGKYYSQNKIGEEEFLNLKKEVIVCIEKNKENILYIEKIDFLIKRMKYEEFSLIWNKVIKKLPSPYINQDIYDLIVFRKNYTSHFNS